MTEKVKFMLACMMKPRNHNEDGVENMTMWNLKICRAYIGTVENHGKNGEKDGTLL